MVVLQSFDCLHQKKYLLELSYIKQTQSECDRIRYKSIKIFIPPIILKSHGQSYPKEQKKIRSQVLQTQKNLHHDEDYRRWIGLCQKPKTQTYHQSCRCPYHTGGQKET